MASLTQAGQVHRDNSTVIAPEIRVVRTHLTDQLRDILTLLRTNSRSEFSCSVDRLKEVIADAEMDGQDTVPFYEVLHATLAANDEYRRTVLKDDPKPLPELRPVDKANTPRMERTPRHRPKAAGVSLLEPVEARNLPSETRRMRLLLSFAEQIGKDFADTNSVLVHIIKRAVETLDADRGSVFLVDHESKELYSRVFDVTAETPLADMIHDHEIRFPMTQGIAGSVASTTEPLIITDAYHDDRFNPDADKATGYKTHTILCVPLVQDAKVLGVAQLINKRVPKDADETAASESFDTEDLALFTQFSHFCAQAVYRTLQREELTLAEERKDTLIRFARQISEQFPQADHSVLKIMKHAVTVMGADRGSVFLKDEEAKEYVSHVFDVTSSSVPADHASHEPIRVPFGAGIVGRVGESNESIIIEDAASHPLFNNSVDKLTGYETKTIMCAPLRRAGEVIGVAQLINRAEGREARAYNEYDMSRFEEMLLFCANAIWNAHTFTEQVRANQKSLMQLRLAQRVFESFDLAELLSGMATILQELLQSERASIFLLDKPRNELFSKVFDVPVGGYEQDREATAHEIRFPADQGIAGAVVQSGKPLNIRDAYADPRFNKEVDKKTGFRTSTLLCAPIRDHKGEIVGVAQIVNKIGDLFFRESDEKLFDAFSLFCGIGIHNFKLFNNEVISKNQNQALLDLAKTIFDVTKYSAEDLVRKFASILSSLLDAEKCSVFLIDFETDELYSNLFDFAVDEPQSATKPAKPRTSSAASPEPVKDDGGKDEGEKEAVKEIRFPKNHGIAGHVATTGESQNIPDAYADPRFNQKVDLETGFKTRSILCMPIRDSERILGVAQLINKRTEPHFTKKDEELFEAFAVFCGIGLNNAQLYERERHEKNRARVALDLLSFHAFSNEAEIEDIETTQLPAVREIVEFPNYTFSPRNIPEKNTNGCVVRMFEDLGLVNKFNIPRKNLLRFVATVHRNYRPVAYHNWYHALSVAHTMFAISKHVDLSKFITDLELLSLITACLCHDIDHRGTNNSFQVLENSPLAEMYGSSSVMENHHIAHTLTIIRSEGHDIFQNLPPEEYAEALNLVKSDILATDLALYFKHRDGIRELASTFDVNEKNHRRKFQDIVMTCCDISAITKPWEISRPVADLIYQEFWEQGDREKELGKTPMEMMDREKAKGQLPKLQLGFIDFVCKSAYEIIAEYDVEAKPLLDGLLANRERWQQLKDEQG